MQEVLPTEIPEPQVVDEKINHKKPPTREEVTTAIPEERAEDACDETCPLVQEQKGGQLVFGSKSQYQTHTRIVVTSTLSFFSEKKKKETPSYVHSISRFAIAILYCRAHRTQTEGTTANRGSLLSDKRLQLFRGSVHVLSGLHDVQSE